MRKITREVCEAFEDGRRFRKGNDEVKVFIDDNKIITMVEMSYRGNVIAKRSADYGIFAISDAGWATTTTKERLNGLRGVQVVQRKGIWFLNGTEWITERQGYGSFHPFIKVTNR